MIVKREIDEELYKKSKLNNAIKEEVAWKLSVRNNKSQPVRLIMKDQIPVSTQKGVEVEAMDLSKAKHDEKQGFLTWDLGIKPASERTLTYAYHLRYPR